MSLGTLLSYDPFYKITYGTKNISQIFTRDSNDNIVLYNQNLYLTTNTNKIIINNNK